MVTVLLKALKIPWTAHSSAGFFLLQTLIDKLKGGHDPEITSKDLFASEVLIRSGGCTPASPAQLLKWVIDSALEISVQMKFEWSTRKKQ